MRFTKLLLFPCWCLALFLISCDKTENQPEPTCFDGIMNNGELGVDCGGPCAPCSTLTTPVFFAVFNGEFTNFTNVNLQYGDTIYLSAVTDTVQVNLIFKNLTTPDESNQLYPLISNLLPFVTYNNVDYTQMDPQYSVMVVTKNENNKLSGLFQLRLPHGFNNMDTLRVMNGTFENIPY